MDRERERERWHVKIIASAIWIIRCDYLDISLCYNINTSCTYDISLHCDIIECDDENK